MDFQKLAQKVEILAESAKYDVSCSSSGSDRGSQRGRLGNCAYSGICHSFTPDGRCISLLKILLSNYCAYDCVYCLNRRSNDLPRARLEPRELCELVMAFYRRNYIEGLFLSSAVEKDPDYTFERLTEAVRMLREEYKFNGYIHLKGIPASDPELIRRAAALADRMSFNIELPSEKSLRLLAPQKRKEGILAPMRQLSAVKAEGGRSLPAGQTTQMIVGASPEPDAAILKLSEGLYQKFGLKRVYFSAYMPVVQNSLLPALPPDLIRENRLYQADWLLRFYGFTADEILPSGDLDRSVDPKCGWALRNLGLFPVEINRAPFETLIRVPGLGLKSAHKILAARRFASLGLEDLKRMRIPLKRTLHFVTVGGRYYGGPQRPDRLRELLSLQEQKSEQLTLFAPPSPRNLLTALSGEF